MAVVNVYKSHIWYRIYKELPLHELDTLCVSLECKIEAAEPVTREGVSAALEHDGARLVQLHHTGHNRYK